MTIGNAKATTRTTDDDVAPDGRVLAVERAGGRARDDIHVVLNWAETLRRRGPAR